MLQLAMITIVGQCYPRSLIGTLVLSTIVGVKRCGFAADTAQDMTFRLRAKPSSRNP